MSSYLIINKNDVLMGTWSRSTKLYEVCESVPFNYDGKKAVEFDPEKEFYNVIEKLKNDIIDNERLKKKYEKMLEGNISYEERFSTLSTIEEIENEIEECKETMSEANFMLYSFNCSKYNYDEEDNKVKNLWTWYKD